MVKYQSAAAQKLEKACLDVDLLLATTMGSVNRCLSIASSTLRPSNILLRQWKAYEREIIRNIERELNAIDPAEMIEVNLRHLLIIYKAVEDWRKFFHNRTHCPAVDDVNRYVGNRKHGMYAAIYASFNALTGFLIASLLCVSFYKLTLSFKYM